MSQHSAGDSSSFHTRGEDQRLAMYNTLVDHQQLLNWNITGWICRGLEGFWL